MNILFHKSITGREFGAWLLNTKEFLTWADEKQLHVQTDPPLEGLEFVQAEALLCAIERAARRYSPAEAWAIVQINQDLMRSDYVRIGQASGNWCPEDDPGMVWLIGANSHKKWRGLLEDAIARGELRLFDPVSLLPVTPPDAGSAPSREPGQVSTVSWGAMTKDEKKAAWDAMAPAQRRDKANELVKKHQGNRTAAGREVGITGKRIAMLLNEAKKKSELEAPPSTKSNSGPFGLPQTKQGKASR